MSISKRKVHGKSKKKKQNTRTYQSIILCKTINNRKLLITIYTINYNYYITPDKNDGI